MLKKRPSLVDSVLYVTGENHNAFYDTITKINY